MHGKGVTWRAVVIGLVLIPPNSYWIAQRSIVWGGSPTYMSIFYNVVFCVTLLTLLNLLFKRFSERFALTQGELLTVYVILCMGAAVAGLDMVGMLESKMDIETNEKELKAIITVQDVVDYIIAKTAKQNTANLNSQATV